MEKSKLNLKSKNLTQNDDPPQKTKTNKETTESAIACLLHYLTPSSVEFSFLPKRTKAATVIVIDCVSLLFLAPSEQIVVLLNNPSIIISYHKSLSQTKTTWTTSFLLIYRLPPPRKTNMSSSSSMESSPATAALVALEQRKSLTRGGASNSLSKLSRGFDSLNFDDSSENSCSDFSNATFDAFPVIEWDTNEDVSDSGSVGSLDAWNSILEQDFGSTSSLGGQKKRGRSDSTSSSKRRCLVRSRNIKSDLSSLAVLSFSARTA